ncbi:AaceriABR214Cp [[Ashbya] aceris (nom. inval.)]|nr:AaceriABR214Cp [[Ashbya] aceris (nom. inval.)]
MYGSALQMKSRSSESRKRQNVVLSTSFVSTRRMQTDEGSVTVPSSPLHTRQRNNTLGSLRQEVRTLEAELERLQNQRQEVEKAREATSTEIYQGTYTRDHLQRHSQRLQANTQLRDIGKNIKRLEEQLLQVRAKIDAILSLVNNVPEEPAEEEKIEERSAGMGAPLGASVSASSSSAGGLSTPVGYQDPENVYYTDFADDYIQYSYFTDDEGDRTVDNTFQDFGSELEGDSDTRSDQNNSLQPDKKAKEIATATWLFSDYLQSLQDSNASREFILTKANSLVALLSKNPEIKHDMVFSAFSNTINGLLMSQDKLVTSAGYRICRYLITDNKFIENLMLLRIDVFLVISLTKDNRHDMEREQAIKLVREFITYDAGINQAIVQVIISCVEKTDDKLRMVCIETLLELALVKPSIVKMCGGFRVLESLLTDSNLQVSLLVLETFLSMMDLQATRCYVVEYCNVSSILSALSDWQSKSSLNVERLQNSMCMMARLFKNYNGLIILSRNEFRPLKELISFLQAPVVARYVLDLLLDVLLIKPLPYNEKKGTGSRLITSQFPNSPAANQYVALVVRMLGEANLVDALVSILLNTRYNDNLNHPKRNVLFSKTRHILAEYLSLAVNINSWNPDYVSKIHQSLSSIKFTEAFLIERINSKLNKHRTTLGIPNLNMQKTIIDFSKAVTRATLLTDVDELVFKKMVFDTRVLQTKDFSQWNWDVLSDLCEGPLCNPRRLEELSRTTKFIRRLLVFYRPFRYRFSTVSSKATNAKQYVKVGCQFFNTLLQHYEGLKVLLDDSKIIPQLASTLYKAMEGHILPSKLFSPWALQNTLCGSYFKFLGVLMKSKDGINILEKWNMFTVIYKMFQPSPLAEEYLLLMLPELDLSHSIHCRIIFSKALVDSREVIRINATRVLGEMISSVKSADPTLEEFMLNLLVAQLYDLSSEVVAVADQILYHYCLSQSITLALKPAIAASLNQLVFIGSPILFELMASSAGFKLLDNISYIEKERQLWQGRKNREYVHIVEEFLEKELRTGASSGSSIHTNLPLHFYHSLARSEEGINMIQKNGDFLAFTTSIKRALQEMPKTLDEYSILKSNIWCCGYIGSTELGIKLLDKHNVIGDLVELAMTDENPTARFTAFYALGLISKTEEGCELLDELGWDCCIDVRRQPVGICVPNNITTFLSYPQESLERTSVSDGIDKCDCGISEQDFPPLEVSQYKLIQYCEKAERDVLTDDQELKSMLEDKARQVNAQRRVDSTPLQFQDDPVSAKIFRLVGKLGNHILTNGAIKELTELESRYGASKFETQEMFNAVFNLMAQYRFKPSVRKFLCDVFINKRALENIARRDRRRRK